MNIIVTPEVQLTEAQKFRGRRAKGAADRMETSVNNIEKRSGLITKIALIVSTPHQMAFLLASVFPFLHWGSPQQIVESVGMLMIALSAPILSDLTILNCVETIAAPAVGSKSKRRAFGFLAACALVSGSVNFLAPAPLLVKGLAAFVVSVILMAEGLRDIIVDFRKVEEIETDIAIGIPAKAAPRPIDQAELRARKEAGYDNMTTKERAKWTRDRRKRMANRAPKASKAPKGMPALTPVQHVELMANAPTSPAPVGA
jgi:hypothetical protein